METNKNTKKLPVTDYLFNYKGIDFNNAFLTYYFSEMKYVNYKDGKRQEELTLPLINFSITGDDTNGETYEFSFVINLSITELNAMPFATTNINKHVINGDIFLHAPARGVEIIDFNDNDNIFREPTTISVAKVEAYEFVFRIAIPNLFIWFQTNFKQL